MSDLNLKISFGKASRGRYPVCVMVNDEAVHNGEVNPHRVAEIDAFIAELQTALPTMNGEAPKVRSAIMQLAKPRKKKPADAAAEVFLTDCANAQQLVRDHSGAFKFNAATGQYMVYDRRWVPDETGEVSRWAKLVARGQWKHVSAPPVGVDQKTAIKHAIRSESSAGIAGMMKLAQTESGITVTPKQLDADGMLFNHLGGTLDLRTGISRPHNPADLITKMAPVLFNPAAAAHPTWSAFLHKITAGSADLTEYLQRLAGLFLTADATVQELYIAYGSGANGKSVFFDTLMGMMGEYSGSAPPGLLTHTTQNQHPTEIADLQGKRVVIASETEESSQLRIQLVKKLTGDAKLKGRFMRCDFFEFDRTHKLVIVTNNKPIVREATNAIWRRLRLIPFVVTIPLEEQNKDLLEELKAEWPGILLWALCGCLDWTANGMQTPEAVKVATKDYRENQDFLKEYTDERCIIDPKARVSRAEIYADFSEWAKKAGDAHVLDRTAFFDRLRRMDGIGESKAREQGEPTRMFTGIGLLNLGSQLRQAQERAGNTVAP